MPFISDITMKSVRNQYIGCRLHFLKLEKREEISMRN